MSIIKPAALRPGNTIGIVAPPAISSRTFWMKVARTRTSLASRLTIGRTSLLPIVTYPAPAPGVWKSFGDVEKPGHRRDLCAREVTEAGNCPGHRSGSIRSKSEIICGSSDNYDAVELDRTGPALSVSTDRWFNSPSGREPRDTIGHPRVHAARKAIGEISHGFNKVLRKDAPKAG